MYSHQDWTTVYLKPPNAKKEVTTATKPDHKAKEYSSRARKLEADLQSPATAEAPPVAPLLMLSQSARQELISTRVKRKMTQQQLAQQCNLQPTVIKSLEGGGVVQDKSVLQKVNRVLNIHLRFDQ